LKEDLKMTPGPYRDTYRIAGTVYSGELLRLMGRNTPFAPDRLYEIRPDEAGSITVRALTPNQAVLWAAKASADPSVTHHCPSCKGAVHAVRIDNYGKVYSHTTRPNAWICYDCVPEGLEVFT
jgi:hypothetical protein